MIKINSMKWVGNAISHFRPMLFLMAAILMVTGAMGQATNPSLSTLPYSFTSHTGSTFPASLSVGKFSGAGTGTLIGTDFTTDATYTSGGAANAWNDEGANGIAWQSNGTFSSGCFKIRLNTTGTTSITVGWIARTIANNANTNLLSLQYRVGSSGTWTDVTGTTFTSAAVGSQTFSGISIPTTSTTEVQLRWNYYENSTGARDRIAVDEISVVGVTSTPCVTPPNSATALSMTASSATAASGSFTAASGADSYLVIASAAAFTGTASITDGTSYAAGNTIGNGQVIQSGAATAITIASGLTGNRTYFMNVFSQNSACTGGPKYKTTSPANTTFITCPIVPTSPTATATTNSINVSWGSSLGSGASAVTYTLDVSTNNTFTAPVTGSPFTISDPTVSQNVTGLSANTLYYYRVRANGSCSSAYTATGSITTPCASVNPPYTQDFQSPTVPAIPNCTSIQNAGTGNNWITSSNPGSGFTTKTLQYTYSSTAAANAWWYTQGLNLTAGTTYRLIYRYGNNSSTFVESLEVKYGTSAINSSMTNTLATHASVTGATATADTILFTAPTTAVYYIGFHAYSAADQFYLFVDDISLIEVPACSGTPAAANTVSNFSTACFATNIGLSLSSTYNFTGITYQWQSSPDNVTYTNISGATSATYTATGQTAATWYRCVVTCTNGGASINSTPVQVNQTALASCYCVPSSVCTNDRITDFQLNSLSNASGTTCGTTSTGYTLYGTTPSNLTTTLAQGASYTATISAVAGNGNGTGVAIWIDYNDNGVFETSERSDNGATKFASNTTGTLIVNVPAAAPLGNHRLRITAMRNSLSNAQDPCTPANANGETEDYTITIATQASCSGTPSAGSTSTSANNVCTPAAFNLSLSGATTDAGISYQWQSSPDNVTYTNISGATSATYAAIGVTTSTWYQCVLTCANGGLFSASTPVQVNVTQCINISNGNTTTCSANFYDTQGATVNYLNNEDYTYTIYPNPGNVVRVVFSAFATESGLDILSIYNGNSTSSPLVGSYSGTTSPGTVTSSAADGSLTFRFVSDGSTRAAGWQSVVSCIALPGCSGTVTGGTTVASSSYICSAATLNLSLSGQTSGVSGLTFQWQSSPDNVTYTNISGATLPNYSTTVSTETWFRCVITCTASSSSANSTPVDVKVKPSFMCSYCSVTGTDCSVSDVINNVTLTTLNNTTTCSANGYSDYTSGLPIPQLTPGSTYPMSVSVGAGGTEYVGVWIDYNQSGTFDATEFTALGSGNGVTVNGNIVVPASPAATGLTVMRVRVRYNTALAGGNACLSYTYGETEDYVVNVAAPTCITSPTSPANGGNGCSNPNGVELSWPAFSGATQYDVYFGTTNPPTTLVSDNQTALTYNAGVLSGGTYYWAVVPQVSGATTCNPWSFTLVERPDLSAADNLFVCEGTTISLNVDNNAPTQSTGNTFAWTGPNGFTSTSQSPSLNNATISEAGLYTVVVTNVYGCTADTSTMVNVSSNPVLTLDSVHNVTCNGYADGVIYMSGTSGTEPYLFSDFVTINTNDGVATNVPPGAYDVVIQDALNCISLPVSITVNEPDVLTASPSSNAPVCKGSTLNISSNPAGGTSPYSYQWSGPSGFSSVNQNVTFVNGLDGMYTITLTDANNCTATASIDAQVDDAPTVSAGADQQICNPSTVQLAGNFGGGASSATWTTSGDGTFNNAGSVSAIYTPGSNDVSSGSVVLTLTTNDPVGVCNAVSDNMIVSIASGIPADPGPVTGAPPAVCPPLTGLNLSVAPIAGATSYNWYLGPNIQGVTFTTPTNGTAVTVDIVAASNSTYSIRVVGVNACGSSLNYSSAFIRRTVSVPATVTGSASACPGETMTYTATGVTGATSYVWTGPAGVTFDGNPSPYTANDLTVDAAFASTVGSICVAAQVGCFTSATKCITVTATPPQPGALTGPLNVCPSQQNVQYSVPAVAGTTYTWTAPANSTIQQGQGTASVIINYASNFVSGNLSVVASSTCGTSVPRQATVIGNGSSGVVVGKINSISGPTDNLCGTTATYTALPLISGASYTWTVPSGVIINGQTSNTVSLTFPASGLGNSSISVTAQIGCSASQPRALAIKGAPVSPVITSPSAFCASSAGNVFSVPSRPGVGYSWSVPPGSVITAGAGTNSITVTFGSAAGNVVCNQYNACGSASTKVVIAYTCRQSQASVTAAPVMNVNVYPNPASHTLNIEFMENQAGQSMLQLRDLSGKIVLEERANVSENNTVHAMDISRIAKGVYMLNVTGSNGTAQSKIVIE